MKTTFIYLATVFLSLVALALALTRGYFIYTIIFSLFLACFSVVLAATLLLFRRHRRWRTIGVAGTLIGVSLLAIASAVVWERHVVTSVQARLVQLHSMKTGEEFDSSVKDDPEIPDYLKPNIQISETQAGKPELSFYLPGGGFTIYFWNGTEWIKD